MKCEKCGIEGQLGDLYCKNCGAPLTNVSSQASSDQQSVTNQPTNKPAIDCNEGNKYSIIGFFLMSAVPLVLSEIAETYSKFKSIILTFASVSALIGFVLIIYTRIAYPNNTFAKVLLIIMIVNVVLMIVGFIILLIACDALCSGMGDMG